MSLSISVHGKNRSGSPNKFTFPVRCRIEEDFAKSAVSCEMQSQGVESICINLILSESSPLRPFIGRVSQFNRWVACGLELTWLMGRDVDEDRVQEMLGRPMLAILLATFKHFCISNQDFLSRLSTYPNWSNIISSISSSEVDYFLEYASSSPFTLDEETFWSIIQQSKQGASSNEQQEELLISALSELEPENIGEFNAIFRTKMSELYRWDLWAIAYIINGGCSDDGFTEFRAWLICRGRDFYMQAIERPEFVGEQVPEGSDKEPSIETTYGFDLIAGRVYEQKTGFHMFTDFSVEPRNPSGYRWDDDELSSLFPETFNKFQ